MKLFFTFLLFAFGTSASAQFIQCYEDNDKDGYGDPNKSHLGTAGFTCESYDWSSNGFDCDDNNAQVNPGTVWYEDKDGDKFTTGKTLQQCSRPAGYSTIFELERRAVLYCSSFNANARDFIDCDDSNPTELNDFLWWFIDNDQDGYIADKESLIVSTCKPFVPGVNYVGFPHGSTPCPQIDCNDNNPLEKPGQQWYPDADNDGYVGVMNAITQCARPGGYKTANELSSITVADCNDNDPENFPALWWQDADGDGYTSGTQLRACQEPAGYIASPLGNDCDDSDPNNHSSFVFWYSDLDGDKHGKFDGITSCGRPAGRFKASELLSLSDCNDNNSSVYPGATEICDNNDNNCNQETDEGATNLFWQDADGDGAGNAAVFVYACSAPAGYVPSMIGSADDCDDDNPAIKSPKTYYRDADNDGYGEMVGFIYFLCSVDPPGYSAHNTDCNDQDKTIYPGAPELCDAKDNNCNNQVDEGATNITYYADADGDGYGNPALSQPSCTVPAGYVTDKTDCNDQDKTIYPGAPELCDGKDNNCNEQIDEGGGSTDFYQDADQDGYGNSTVLATGCTMPAGYVSNKTDCNDQDKTIYPGAPELCDGKDNNCNGQIDEGTTNTRFYRDSDGDGHGNSASSKTGCIAPNGYVSNKSDCNDNDKTIHPGAVEICDGKDNNCNGQVDEGGAKITYYRDADGDGYGNPSVSKQACTKPSGYVTNNKDCNDNKSGINPGAAEICNGLDDNCNGLVDEITITNLTTTNITSSSAKLNWTSTSNPTVFHVNFKKSGSSSWQTVLVPGTSRSVTINSLSRNQTYNWRIRALCGKNLTDYSSTATFKTLTGGSNTGSKPAPETKATVAESGDGLEVMAMPNPARFNFTLTVKGNDQKAPMKMVVVDIYGRIMEERILYNEEVIKLGDQYRPGVYIVKFIQGKQSKQLKLIKVPE